MSSFSGSQLQSFWVGLKMTDLWLYFAKNSVQSRFRRSFLGLGWIVLNSLAFALGAGYLWAQIFQIEAREFVPYIGLGFAIWGFVAASLTDGCDVIFASSSFTKQIRIPYSVFITQSVLVHFIYFFIAFLSTLIASYILGLAPTLGSLWALVGILIMFTMSFLTVTTLSYLGARFRDLSHAIGSILQILFVMTPVIYPAEVISGRNLDWIVNFNPVNSLLEVIRTPVIHGTPAELYHYSFLACITVILLLTAMCSSAVLGRRIIFWL